MCSVRPWQNKLTKAIIIVQYKTKDGFLKMKSYLKSQPSTEYSKIEELNNVDWF